MRERIIPDETGSLVGCQIRPSARPGARSKPIGRGLAPILPQRRSCVCARGRLHNSFGRSAGRHQRNAV